MKDMLGMMKQAKELQGRMQAVQEEIAALTVDGAAGGGLVTVTLTGKGEVKSLRIDPSLAKPDEVEILEDLVVAARTEAAVLGRDGAPLRADASPPLAGGPKLSERSEGDFGEGCAIGCQLPLPEFATRIRPSRKGRAGAAGR